MAVTDLYAKIFLFVALCQILVLVKAASLKQGKKIVFLFLITKEVQYTFEVFDNDTNLTFLYKIDIRVFPILVLKLGEFI